MLNTRFPPWPSFSEEEGDAVRRVLLSNKVNYWTGEETRQFEKEFAAYTGCEHAVALANGTLALDLALLALGIGTGHEVIVTPRTFIASVSSVVNAGSVPVFADVDRDTQNLSARTIESVLTSKSRAIVVVHLAGMPADMDPIMALARKHDLRVIEDCAQAHGARYRGRPVGSIGDIGAWSFCQDKIMSTGGEGGMVTTNDRELWSTMWSYKDHGKSWDAVYERVHPAGYRWLHESFGTNWRMTELQGVLGRIQLGRLPQWNATRNAHANRIWETCRKIAWLRVPDLPDYVVHAMYKAYVFVQTDRLPPGWTRDTIIESLNARGIPVFSGSCSEVYLEKAFEKTEFAPAQRLKVAKELGESSLMFPVHPTLKNEHIDRICRELRRLAAIIDDGDNKQATL